LVVFAQCYVCLRHDVTGNHSMSCTRLLHCCPNAVPLAGASKAASSTFSCSSEAMDPSASTPNLIQLALQHDHWSAVPLLIEAGVPWPDYIQPSWDLDNSQCRKLDMTAHGLVCLEVGFRKCQQPCAIISKCFDSCIQLVRVPDHWVI
jgi:hypothetical protein